MEPWIEAIKEGLGSVLYISPEGKHFYTLSAVGAGALVFFGKLIASSVGGTKKGFVPVALGLILAVVLVVLGLAAFDLYVADRISSDGARLGVQIAVGAAVFLALGVTLGKILMDVSWGMALATMVLTFAAAFATVYVTNVGIDSVSGGFKAADRGSETVSP